MDMKPYFETSLGKLFCGDCLEIMKQLPDDSIDLVLTDPPYELNWRQSINFKNRKSMFHHMEETQKWDKGVRELYKYSFKEFDRIVKYNGSILIFTRSEYITWAVEEGRKNNFDNKATIVWHKCIAGQEKIIIKYKNQVRIITIRELARKRYSSNIYILGEKDGKISWVKLKSITKSHKENGLIIQTKNGKKIRVSSKHRLPVNSLSHLVEAKDIQEKDNLFVGNIFPKLPKCYKKCDIEIKRSKTNLEKVQVDKIKKDKFITYYDLEIESSSHLFCNADGILSHNTNPIPQVRKKNYLSSIEMILWLARYNEKKCPFTFNFKTQNEMHNFIEMPLCGGKERTSHPTQKPLKLFMHLLEIHSNKNDLILDPFLGSGTTAVACEKLNRRWIGIEMNPEYIEIAKKRIEEETKQGKLNL